MKYIIKKVLISISLFFIMICFGCTICFGSTISDAQEFYDSVLTVNGVEPDDTKMEYWYGILSNPNSASDKGVAYTYKNGVFKAYDTNGDEVFDVNDVVREEIVKDLEYRLGLNGSSSVTANGLTEQEKKETKEGVDAYLAQLKDSTGGEANTNKYIQGIQNKIDEINNIWDGAVQDEENGNWVLKDGIVATSKEKAIDEYRLELYEQALNKAKNEVKYEEQFKQEAESEGIDTIEEIEDKIEQLEKEKRDISNMSDGQFSALYSGRTREEVYEELDAEINFYMVKKGEIAVANQNQSPIYRQPEKITVADSTATAVDDVISDAESILDHGSMIDRTTISNFSNSIFNIFLAIGTVVAVVVGALLGIKFMTSSVEGKADVKKMLIVYVAGCVAVFGALGIWKIVVTILQNI